jgi:adenosylcobinamide-phosphate synthase
MTVAGSRPTNARRQPATARQRLAAARAAQRRRNRRNRALADAAGLAAGYALDAWLGDPARWHPVAGYGRLAGALERRMWAPDRQAGARFTATAVGVPVALAAVAATATRRRPLARATLTALVTWTVLGGRSLRREADAMADALSADDLEAARARLPSLCGRDASRLDRQELARATVESVAENTSDAEVGPLVWGALAGLPGLVGYRAVNTLDAMVGHRSPRYDQFGTASARLDDIANLGPSRFTAALTVAAAPLVNPGPKRGLSVARAAWVWLRQGHRHPSPNSGQCEAAMAGALGVSLGGRNVYQGRVEDRPALGTGPRPSTVDIRRATQLSGAVGLAALVLCVGHVLNRARSRG